MMLGLMTDPLVTCTACDRQWFSATLAAGLRTVGKCPRCGGELRFAADPTPAPEVAAAPQSGVAPHLVLGVPRR